MHQKSIVIFSSGKPMGEEVAFSIVVTSRGGNRLLSLEKMLSSLERDSALVEVILVDQTNGPNLANLIKKFPNLNVHHIPWQLSGLSMARNLALSRISGSYVLFGDDDAYYSPYLYRLKEALTELAFPPAFCGVTSDPESGGSYGPGRETLRRGQPVFPSTAFRVPVSITLGLAVDQIRYFDESLGLGARFPSGEETDLVLDVLARAPMVVIPEFHVHHPFKAYSPREAYRYAIGFGFVTIKAIRLRSQWGVLVELGRVVVRSLGGILLHGLRGNFNRSLACLARLAGLAHGVFAGLIVRPAPLAPVHRAPSDQGGA